MSPAALAGPHSGAVLAERRRQAQHLAARVRAKHISYFEPAAASDSDGLYDDYSFSDEEEEDEELPTEEESDAAG